MVGGTRFLKARLVFIGFLIGIVFAKIWYVIFWFYTMWYLYSVGTPTFEKYEFASTLVREEEWSDQVKFHILSGIWIYNIIDNIHRQF